MMISIVAAALVTLLAMAPGWVLARGHAPQVGQSCAAMVASLAAMLLATALLGAAASLLSWSLPSSSLIAVSITGIAAAAAVNRRHLATDAKTLPEWQGIVVGLVLVSFGLFSIASAFTEDAQGDLLVHAWYNADWFKHMGHVHALTNFGVPARDMFGGAGPLHYYWLFYLLPGAAGSIGAEPWVALSTVNAVISLLLGYLFYSLVRMSVASANGAMVLTLAAMIVLAPHGFFFWALGGGSLEAFLGSGLAPAGSGLLATSQVIPQHAMATAVLCSWIVLAQPGAEHGAKARSVAMHVLPLAALASLMAISTMLGAIYLVGYGLMRLYLGRLRAVPELTVMVVASVAVVIVLQVLKLDNPASAIESPLLIDEDIGLPPWRLAIAGLLKAVGFVGLPLFALVPFLIRFRPATTHQRYVLVACLALFAAGAIAVMASQILLPARPAAEIFVRTKIPFSIAAMIAGAMIIYGFWGRSSRHRIAIPAALVALGVVSTPSIYAFAVWQSNFGDTFTTRIPQADREALSRLRELSGPDDLVWQYPEKPLLGDPAGGDNWSAVFAGRVVANSERATDYAVAAPMIEASQQWFGGEGGAIPDDIDWVYLSRALHSETYDGLVASMKGNAAFDKRLCTEDACLFERAGNGSAVEGQR